MFVKPFRVKSQTAIKGSDRKKLRAQVGNQLSVESDILTELVPNKDDITVLKLNTHARKDVIVYNVQGNPAFFELDSVMYPTVYTLWRFPGLLPVFTTWPPVFKKLTNGADLMLPGLVVKGEVGPNFMDGIAKGTPCSIKLIGNKSPVAVGKTALSAEDMYGCAMRGKGVNILHTYRDNLWALGSKSCPPQIDDPEMIEVVQKRSGSSIEYEEAADLGDSSQDSGTDHDKISDDSMCSESGSTDQIQRTTDALETLAMGTADNEEVCENQDQDTRSPQEKMDELLTWCFMCALKSRVKKSDLPLLTSNFFSNYVLPCCPRDKTLDVKKSSYKKLSKFLKEMQDRGLIRVKELSKGVESIVEVYKDHEDLRSFTVPDTLCEPSTSEVTTSTTDSFMHPEITELFTVTAASSSFFRLFHLNKGSALTAQEIRNYLTEYVKDNKLQKEDNKGYVILDAVLSDLLLNKGEYTEYMSWDEMISRCQSKMSPAYMITSCGEQGAVKKGKLEPIKFIVEKRGGNKKVTILHNLELYGIDAQKFGHEVQLGMACSASVSERPGKPQSMEVLIQGNQVHFASNLLLSKYKIPRKYIQGMEKAPKGKKK